MAVKIRLARGGAKKKPYYRIVVANALKARDGDFLEKVGTYSPMLGPDDPNRLALKIERIEYWLANGAIPTDRVVSFLQKVGIELPKKLAKKVALSIACRKPKRPR